MQETVQRAEKPTAIHTDLGAIFVSLKLSRSTWLTTSLSPGARREIVEACSAGR
jgi:transposase